MGTLADTATFDRFDTVCFGTPCVPPPYGVGAR